MMRPPRPNLTAVPRRPMAPAPIPPRQAPPPAQPPRKRRKLGDKVIPSAVRDLVPESHAYMDLVAFEQKLDATIARKKLDIQEALKRPLKVKRRLRIFVSHTFFPAKEADPTKEGDTGSVPMWELRVEGRLLDEANPASTQPPQQPAQPQTKTKKFSTFFKSLVIELDKDIYGPDNHLVEWHRTPSTKETDGFQVKRPGDQNVKCTILLLMDHQPMKFKVNPGLAKLLGVHTETRPKIIEALWQYVKTQKLQDSNERDFINCDPYLERIFGVRRMRFMEIPQRLQALLSQPDHIVINHLITCAQGEEGPKKTACYDIEVEVEDPLKAQMQQFAFTQAQHLEIASLDGKILDNVDQVKEMKTRRDFYLGFADAPQEFIRKWLVSQSADLKTMTETSGDPEKERRADYYNAPWVQEGVCRYFYSNLQQRRAQLEQNLGLKHN